LPELSQPGAHFAGRNRGEVRQGLGPAPVLLQKGQIAPPCKAIGLQGARRRAAFLVEVLKPLGQRLVGGHGITGQRSAVRSTTRARKATSSDPMSGVKPSGSSEPKARTPIRAGSQMARRTMAMEAT